MPSAFSVALIQRWLTRRGCNHPQETTGTELQHDAAIMGAAMDQRNMREIRVNWQLGLFIAGMFGLPISLAPIYTAMTNDHPVPRSVLNISGTIAAIFLLMMIL